MIDSNLSRLSLGRHIEILEDERGLLTIEDIAGNKNSQKLNWQTSTVDEPGFGFTDSTFWIRFKINNTSAQSIDWFLVQEDPLLNEVILYTPLKKGGFAKTTGGDIIPFDDRAIKYRCLVFPLSTEPNEEQTYYIRYRSNSAMNLSLTYYNWEGFEERRNKEYPILWGFAGAFLVMFIYNFIIYLVIREKSHVFYISYILLFFFLVLTLNGICFQYFWPKTIWLNNISSPILISLIIFSIVQFARHMFGLENLPTPIDRVLKSYLIMSLAIVLLTIITQNKYAVAVILATALTGVASSTGFFFAVYHTFSRKYNIREARFFLASFAVFLIGIFLYVLRTFSLIPDNYITQYSILIGAIFQIVMLSLVLPDKLILLKNRLAELNQNLEQQVEDRTRQLGTTQENLLQAAHNAGMADMARDNLHNVGNAVNSIYTSIYEISNIGVQDVVDKYKRAKELFGQNIKSSGETAGEDSQYTKLYEYYQMLELQTEAVLDKYRNNLDCIAEKTEEISTIIKEQHELAKSGYLREKVDIGLIMEEVLTLYQKKTENLGVEINKNFAPIPKITSQKPKLVFIFSNIINNAIDSLNLSKTGKKIISIKISSVDSLIHVAFSDTGIGMIPEDCCRVFQHGNPTKSYGTGFGLHTCANYVAELGGQISCKSEGVNLGATYALSFPILPLEKGLH